MSGARLEGAVLDGAHLEGREVPAAELARLRQWSRDYPATLPPADLRGAFLDGKSSLRETVVGDAKLGASALADAHLEGVNLAAVDWTPVLRDDLEARNPKSPDGKTKDGAARLAESRAAVRANRQLATVLRDQGLNEEANRFAYRAQVYQREVLRRQSVKAWPAYLGSLILWALSGYGYLLWRLATAHMLILLTFAAAYLVCGQISGQHLAWYEALLVSFTAVHGRVFIGQFGLDSLLSWIAGIEAVTGILIEGVFVALLIQRFFAR